MATAPAHRKNLADKPTLYQEITDKIIAEFEAGCVPWVQPWGSSGINAALGLPKNAATGRKYSGINILILWSTVTARGFTGQSWLTFRQALALGGNVRKGEKGTTVVYADRFVPDGERTRAADAGEEPEAIPFLKRFTVFNTDQCAELPADTGAAAPPPPEHLILPQAEALIRATGADIRIGGDRAFYVPSTDYIQVPPPAAYFEPVNWHRTVCHELGHWTGAEARLNRDFSGRFCVETRPASANFAETAAFMDDDKRILVFSDAGGTGRSYHADLTCRNQRQRVHYLLEPGWKADAAIQGLGRSNRTNQKQPPVFRPVATDVKGEKRFLSTIARRLDTLGAITRGQRQTGGQGLFRADDNLESAYAKAALRQFYQLLYAGKVEGCSLTAFEDATGLDLCDQDGSLREDLPPITQFLNRILALRIDLQNMLFATFDELLGSRIEGAMAAGTYDIGVETLTAESFHVAERRTVYTHAETGAETRCYRLVRKDRNRPLLLPEALDLARGSGARLLINEQSHRAAVQIPAASLMQDDGSIEARTRLIRPLAREIVSLADFARSHWYETDHAEFAPLWEAEIARILEFSESAFHIITGLLLPIWDRLPAENMRVYRFETDDGERVIGRLVTPEALDRLYQGLGATDATVMPPGEAWTAVIERGAVLDLAGGFQLRRSLVMGVHRVELTGFSDGATDQLKALGLISEIISWRLRLFVPTAEDRGRAIFGAILDRHPLLDVRARAAASSGDAP